MCIRDRHTEELLAGGCAIDETGVPLPDETLTACRKSDSVLLGAVGGPKWDALPGDMRPERALLGLRSGLSLFTNLRPAVVHKPLILSLIHIFLKMICDIIGICKDKHIIIRRI